MGVSLRCWPPIATLGASRTTALVVGARHLAAGQHVHVGGMLAIGLAYRGRLRGTCGIGESSRRAVPTTNLNAVTDSEGARAAARAVFTDASDRRFAAGRLFEFILSVRERWRQLTERGRHPQSNSAG